ncbi:MAG: hypothetical protein QOJ13_2207 [Gaiellales bacterium]|nr:hypothetical protein [Gaiellales bacterium]
MAQTHDSHAEHYLEATRAEAHRLHAHAERLRVEASALMERGHQASAIALIAEQRALELDEVLGRAPQLRLDVARPHAAVTATGDAA